MACRYSNAKYMTIAEIIARRLRAGEFLNNGDFYSRDELARAYHIAPGTAQAVLHELEERGVIACRKGKRSIPAGIPVEQSAQAVCRPVFFRDSWTAETPEYDFLTYCVRNYLLRWKSELRELNSDFAEYAGVPALAPGDVAVVFPSVGEKPDQPPEPMPFHPRGGRIDLLIDQAGNNAVSVFTKKAILDCILHLIRHGVTEVVRVASAHSAFPWFAHIASPGFLDEYSPDCRTSTVMFDDEFELFPDFLSEVISRGTVPGRQTVAILMDDPYLSDYLSGEIRTGAYRPPSRYSFLGTAFNERSMVFPYLDLKLDVLASMILQAVGFKTEKPSAALPCAFHLIAFCSKY